MFRRYIAILRERFYFNKRFLNFFFIFLPPEANVLCSCIMLIHKLRAVEQKGYCTCWSWTKIDMTDMPVDQKEYYTGWSWMKGRGSTVGENGGQVINRGRKRIWPRQTQLH
jgi:hypothetical protein